MKALLVVNQSAEGIFRPDTLTHTRVPIYYIKAIKKDNDNLEPKYRFSFEYGLT